ncbi:Gfo/Idh/MocA family protein [Cyclobacterium marinum]|uniref:Oxidoreductase domain protein n=1 Tax=Cyclobacterium marinum (strain ATCC 25205 / DSM 745 / LMG 13164 / NCIMB 1802) TaxID=880070 RepID=G0IWQ2_CYCMS|nr:Gfo/Idh/MocA family oxidoreductase [Cyclobacterium marinum]AEL24244.1 oxidoreductase domain protein [Cyclobacterium marinum DSM 745]
MNTRRKFILTSAMAASSLSLSALSPFSYGKSEKTPLKVGLIGCGSRGVGLASLMKNLPMISLVACCDTIKANLDKGLAHADKRAKGYADYRELLDQSDIEAVIIATPLFLHFPMAMDAIDAGKHIYVEKTITYSIDEANQLADKVNGSSTILQVGHQYRYYALYHKVKEIIDKGWCGQVTQFECQYHSNQDWRRPVNDPSLERHINWRMYKEYSGGLMTELCAHQIDIVNWFVGTSPEKVTGMGSLDYWKDGRENFDHVRATYYYSKGIISNISSILTNAYKGYSMNILGTEGTVEILRNKAFIYAEPKKLELGTVDGVSGATIKNGSGDDAQPINFESKDGKDLDPTSYALMDFVGCIRESRQPFCDVNQGRATATAVHLGNKAMEEEKYQYWSKL